MQKFFLFLLLVGCSLFRSDQDANLRDLVVSGQFEAAQKSLKNSFYKADTNTMITHLESALLEFEQKKYSQAARSFNDVIEDYDKMYRTKTSEKITSTIFNENSKTYKPEAYEMASTYIYSALSFLLDYQKTGSKNTNLIYSARAQMVGLDSFFQYYNREVENSFYKHDITAKMLAATIHETLATRNDLQIALQLYKDAMDLLQKDALVYKLFNKKAENYFSLSKSNEKLDKASEFTTHYSELKNFLQFKIVQLTFIFRAAEAKTLQKKWNVTDLESVKDGELVSIILPINFIAKKKAKVYSFGLQTAIESAPDSNSKAMIANIGSSVISHFMTSILKMGPTKVSNPMNDMATHQMGQIAATQLAVEFELPIIEQNDPEYISKVTIKNNKNEILKTLSPVVMGATSEVAEYNLKESSTYLYTKKGIRIAAKYVLAVLSSIQVYRTLNGGKLEGENILARAAAMATFVSATKGVALSEKADTRFVSLFPAGFQMAQTNLSAGVYSVCYQKKSDAKAQERCMPLTVEPGKRAIFTDRVL
jgi:hypothetical protein